MVVQALHGLHGWRLLLLLLLVGGAAGACVSVVWVVFRKDDVGLASGLQELPVLQQKNVVVVMQLRQSHVHCKSGGGGERKGGREKQEGFDVGLMWA